ncbi:MAG: hypothetical protein K6E94_04695 [Elusimicrobiaceae bacterium]|nr:hypothetical protein [Elusimicrobiaceae bacterium]
MKRKNIFQFANKFISIIIIFTLLINTMISTGFANLFDGYEDYRKVLADMQEEITVDVEVQTGNKDLEENIEKVIAEKYEEVVEALKRDIALLKTEKNKLTIEAENYRAQLGDGNDPEEEIVGEDGTVLRIPNIHVNDAIVQPRKSVMIKEQFLWKEISKAEAGISQLDKLIKEKEHLLGKIEGDKEGYGRVYAIEGVLFGVDQETTEVRAEKPEQEDEEFYQEHKAEIDEFEENFIYYLYSEIKKKVGEDFFLYTYKLMPYVREKKGKKWEEIASELRIEISKYVEKVGKIKNERSWVKASDLLVQILPYIKEDILEDAYVKILETAHYNLEVAARACQENKGCENYINLMAKESLMYMEGEEEKYFFGIIKGFRDIRGLITSYANREKDYDDYATIMAVTLSTYLALKQYNIVKEIIWINDVAERKMMEKYQPIKGLDIFFASTWVDGYIAETDAKDVLTNYPDIPYLPSRKGDCVNNLGYIGGETEGNIWWELGGMLREEGSKEAENLLIEIFVSDKKPNNGGAVLSSGIEFEPLSLTREGKLVRKKGMSILKLSALANVKTELVNADKIALHIINTSFGDISLETEKEIDLALLKRYTGIKAKDLRKGAVVNEEGERYKNTQLDNISRVRGIGNALDIAIILVNSVGLIVGLGKLAIHGVKLGKGILKAIKAARMASKPIRQFSYIRKNIKSIEYYKTWKIGTRAWQSTMMAMNKQVVPEPAVKVVKGEFPRVTDRNVEQVLMQAEQNRALGQQAIKSKGFNLDIEKDILNRKYLWVDWETQTVRNVTAEEYAKLNFDLGYGKWSWDTKAGKYVMEGAKPEPGKFDLRGKNWGVMSSEAGKSEEGLGVIGKIRNKRATVGTTSIDDVIARDKARYQQIVADFNNKSWFGKKWAIFKGEYMNPLADFTSFDRWLFKASNKMKFTRFALTHPSVVVMGASPVTASTVSVGNVQLAAKAPTEIVYTMTTPASNGLTQAAKTVKAPVQTFRAPLSAPVIKAPSFNLSGLDLLKGAFIVRTMGTITDFDLNNAFWNYPFIAVRKPTDASGSSRLDEGENLYGAGNSINSSLGFI